MNTRRFPRTTNEAFPSTAEYAQSIQHNPKNSLADYLLAIAIGLGGATFLFYWLSY